MSWVLWALLLLVGCRAGTPAAGADAPTPVVAAEQRIDEAFLRDFVTRIASDETEGRGPGTRGDHAGRAILIDTMTGLGLEPGFGDQWEQPFDIVGVTASPPPTWTFRGGEREASLAFREQYMAASGVQSPRVDIEGELVFVGYGIQAPEQDWDDFAGHDLSGKVLLMLNDDPDWDPDLFAGARKLYYGRWTYKYESAARQGAAAAIIIHTTDSAGYPWAVVESSWSGTQFEVPAGSEPRLPVHAWVTQESAEALVALGGHDLSDLVAQARKREFEPVSLGVDTALGFDVQLERTQTANVAGLLRGQTPETVVVSAHHDHLGIGEPDAAGDPSDTIYNGALDNGAAMSQVMGVARALVALEPSRRSVLFLFPAAEEQGLLGSRYFAEHPGRHLVGDVNFELGNIRGETRDVTIYGLGKSTLEDALKQLTTRDVHAEEDVRAGWFYRSDQFSFARVGVPAIWFRSGTDYVGRPAGWGAEQWQTWIGSHYHRPSDELTDDWDFVGLVQDARLGFRLVHRVANAALPPAWYPGDEFASSR